MMNYGKKTGDGYVDKAKKAAYAKVFCALFAALFLQTASHN